MSYSKLEQLGFVDLTMIHPHIIVDLPYATTNNFVSHQVYPENKGYILSELVPGLKKVQEKLDLREEGFRLKLLDGYRPFSVQEKLFSLCPNETYLSKPERSQGEMIKGSRHSRGAAIDLTLCNSQGQELKMPSEFDEFSIKAHRNYDGLDPEIVFHVTLLENLMEEEGFIGLPHEWWHFDFKNWEKFPLLDIPLGESTQVCAE